MRTLRPKQRAPPAKAAAQPTAKAAGLSHTARFKPEVVSAPLQASLRGKKVMVAPKDKVPDYSTAMKNSLEILFHPNASNYGHLLVRVGERIYDLPGPGGTRNQRFTDAMRWVNSHTYGFVYPRTKSQVETLQREFEAFANAGHGFSPTGSGPTKFSCAGFVTAVLKQHAPELEVGLSIGAISVASQLLRAGKHEAVTLYGAASTEAGNADFKFLKLQ